MTVVIAAKCEDYTVIAADTLISDGLNRASFKDFTKLVKFKNFVVGFAGSCTALIGLRELQSDGNYCKRSHMKMKTTMDALAFARDYYSKLRELFDLSPGSPTSKSDEGTYVDILIASSDGIWECDPYLCLVEHEQFACIGSGTDIALGAMKALYTSMDKEDAVTKAIEITCDIHAQCGLPMHLEVI